MLMLQVNARWSELLFNFGVTAVNANKLLMAAGWLVLMLQVNVLLKANAGLRGVQPYCYHQLLMVALFLCCRST